MSIALARTKLPEMSGPPSGETSLQDVQNEISSEKKGNWESRISETCAENISPPGVPLEEKRFWFQRTRHYGPDAIATQPSVFDDPDTAVQYWPPETWENRHRLDPLARWTWREENKLIRKIDLKIMVR